MSNDWKPGQFSAYPAAVGKICFLIYLILCALLWGCQILELELQTIVSCHMGAGNWAIFSKPEKYAFLMTFR